MFIATNQIKFKLLAVVVVIALVMPMVMVPAGAAQAGENWRAKKIEFKTQKGLTLQLEDVLYNMVAYYEIREFSKKEEMMEEKIKDLNNEIKKKVESLDEGELKKLIKDKIESIIEQKEEDKKLYWNKDFVELVVKDNWPDLYEKIEKQIANDEQLFIFKNMVLDDSYSMQDDNSFSLQRLPFEKIEGREYVQKAIEGRSPLGVKLFTYYCSVAWNWEGFKSTIDGRIWDGVVKDESVEVRIWARVHHPLWRFDRINWEEITHGAYTDSIGNEATIVENEGVFYGVIEGIVYQRAYPFHLFIIKGNGTYRHTANFR